MNNDRKLKSKIYTWWTDEWLVILILFVAVAFFLAGRHIEGSSRIFPLYVATFILVICLIELALGVIRKDRQDYEISEGSPCGGVRWFLVISWFVGAIFCLYFFGVLLSVFLMVSLYYVVFTERGILFSGLLGLGYTLFFWLVFSKLAGFTL